MNKFIPIAFVFILPFFYSVILREWNKYINTIGNFDSWISFTGGYLGALLSLWGIWWQINNEKKRNEIKKIEEQKNALYAFFCLAYSVSDKFQSISEVYLKNFLIDGSQTHLPNTFYSFDKELFFQIISNLDLRFYRPAINLLDLLSSFSLKDIKLAHPTKKECLFNETFYCEQLEIFTLLTNELDKILNQDKSNLTENSLTLISILDSKISAIEDSYKSYFTATSREEIRTVFIKLQIELP